MQARQIVIQEVEELFQANDRPMKKTWIVHAVMAKHGKSFADEFGEQAGFDAIERYVREAINKHKLDPESAANPDPQMTLPGFEDVQKAYLLSRDNEPTWVPTHLMTDDECEAKADYLDKLGDGCHRHADELRKYCRTRKASA